MSVSVEPGRRDEFTYQTESVNHPVKSELSLPLTSASSSVPSALAGDKIAVWESVIT